VSGRRSIVLGGLLVALAGCEPYRIEYRKVPAFYEQAVEGGIPERVELEDGTVLVNLVGDTTRSDLERRAKGEGGKPFLIREEREDGSIALRALLPQHVVRNTLTCLFNEEYELMYEELLSARTKLAYEEKGQGLESFTAFMTEHREELAATCNRMLLEQQRQTLIMERKPDRVIELRLHPAIVRRGGYTFTRVFVVGEDLGLKLLMIR